ncbi:MAG: PQQ-binding-like beta-propeller repeat protein [bacterium]|nr:PQQ-binding-like beta-propeller repeat protein [bacterium]
MKHLLGLVTLVFLTITAPSTAALAASPTTAGSAIDPLDQWPQWRGPLATGVAPRADPPVKWSEEDNVRWKVELPGSGHSTPIIWGDRVFLTTAIPHGEALAAPEEHDHGAHHNLPASRRQKFVVLAVDREGGKISWQRAVRDEQPHEGTHETGTWASSSAITDGERLYAFFGSRGLHCLGLDGEPVWNKDFGDMLSRHGHGEGSSPALHGDTVVVNWDHQGESFVVALDKRTGKERWRVSRDEITSWSTPLIVENAGKAQVIVSATKRVRSYDLATGKVLWQAAGLSRNVVASPVAADGMVFVGNSYDWQAMLAIRLEKATGEVNGTDAIVWTRDRDTPYVPSPLLYDGMLMFLKHSQGFLTNLDAATGETLYGPVRLPSMGMIFASPVGAAGRVYIASRNGATLVVERGEKPVVLARNQLDDSFSASPAAVGGELYLRGEKHLYCLARDS